MSGARSLIDLAAEMAAEFALEASVRGVTPHAGGHIHDSFVVATSAGRWFLQRMNTRVFREPERVMENIAAVTAHLARTAPDSRRLPRPVRTQAGGWIARDALGECWRMFTHVDGAVEPRGRHGAGGRRGRGARVR